MMLNHVGIATRDIDEKVSELGDIIKIVSQKIYDPIQEVELQLVKLGDALIELVAGKKVEGFLKKGQSFYHVCFEVDNLEKIKGEYEGKGIFLSEPTPAVLFNNRMILFVYFKGLGLVEFLEKEKDR